MWFLLSIFHSPTKGSTGNNNAGWGDGNKPRHSGPHHLSSKDYSTEKSNVPSIFSCPSRGIKLTSNLCFYMARRKCLELTFHVWLSPRLLLISKLRSKKRSHLRLCKKPSIRNVFLFFFNDTKGNILCLMRLLQFLSIGLQPRRANSLLNILLRAESSTSTS